MATPTHKNDTIPNKAPATEQEEQRATKPTPVPADERRGDRSHLGSDQVQQPPPRKP